jgi:hypothetical protein
MKLSKKTRDVLEEYEYESYMTTPEQCADMLEECGFCIIPGILNDNECIQYESDFWNYLEKTSSSSEKPITRNHPETWTSNPIEKIGHEQFVWDIRQNESVAKIFADYWKCTIENLLVSFEPASIEFPPECTNRGWFKKTKFSKKSDKMIRGYITLVDIDRGDSTFCFIDKSSETQKRIRCLRGDMILWDNTIMHCETGPIEGRKFVNVRMGINLCYMPRSATDDKTIKRKKKHFTHRRVTTYPPVNYDFVENRVESDLIPVLSPIGQSMAGFVL